MTTKEIYKLAIRSFKGDVIFSCAEIPCHDCPFYIGDAQCLMNGNSLDLIKQSYSDYLIACRVMGEEL